MTSDPRNRTPSLSKLTTAGQKLEPEIRAALIAEPDPEETRVEGDSETRELAKLTERASVGDILLATFEKRQTEGAPAELQKHYGLGSHQVPLEMLRIDRSVEERAAATVPASIGDASQAQVITPVFQLPATAQFHGNRAADRANWCRIFPSFEHPSISERAVHRFDRSGPDRRHVCCQLTSARKVAGEFQLHPHRRGTLRGSRCFAAVGLERRLQEKLDQQAIEGTDGLLTGTNLPNNNVSATSTFALYLSGLLYGRVDGRYARTPAT